jgi:hypothetical protein
VETDFSTLASRVAAAGDLDGCIILSRDGLVLGSHPPGGEAQIRAAWLKVASLGDLERGFVELPTEVWAFARRGPYIGFAVAGHGSRPGIMLDHLDQVLLVAEESRSRRDAVRAPESVDLARSGPRVPLHPDTKEPVPAEVSAPGPAAVEPAPAPEPAPEPEPEPEPEVDRVSLAFEFSQLLQEMDQGDE